MNDHTEVVNKILKRNTPIFCQCENGWRNPKCEAHGENQMSENKIKIGDLDEDEEVIDRLTE